MKVKVPSSSRRKALFVIDAQPRTLSAEAEKYIPQITAFIAATDYDAYVEASYFADEQSMFFKQGGFLKPKEEAGTTAPLIIAKLLEKQAPHFSVSKTARSCFKAANAFGLAGFLADREIEEIHFVGFDINDCVLASAFDAIDLGYFSYVIEELCHHSAANENLKTAALSIFREQSMLAGEEPVKIISLS